VKRIDPQPPQPTPTPPQPPRAELPPQAHQAIARLETALRPQATR
jgi:hypothetical protein